MLIFEAVGKLISCFILLFKTSLISKKEEDVNKMIKSEIRGDCVEDAWYIRSSTIRYNSFVRKEKSHLVFLIVDA